MNGNQRAHLVVGGFPPGSPAGHDMNYARLQLLQQLAQCEALSVTVANDYEDLERWLPGTDVLITYVAGPYPAGSCNQALQRWLEDGGRWFALHGTSGGKAVRAEHAGRPVKKMVKSEHHWTLGSFFINHPPISEFEVTVVGQHRVTRGLPQHFIVQDELYLVELQQPDDIHILLTTELVADPSPPGFGFHYDEDTARLADGKSRALGYAREVGQGEIVYVALGHCHVGRVDHPSPVDVSIDPLGKMPIDFRGIWESETFSLLLQNGIAWGLDRP